jgi:hypothetical protein
MYKRLEASKPPPKPEIEIISDLVNQFKKSMETYDLITIQNVSEFAPGRRQFLQQFFANYQSFQMNVSGFQYIATDHKATAEVKLNQLVNRKGQSVQPGAWGKFPIVVQKNSAGQWRIYW